MKAFIYIGIDGKYGKKKIECELKNIAGVNCLIHREVYVMDGEVCFFSEGISVTDAYTGYRINSANTKREAIRLANGQIKTVKDWKVFAGNVLKVSKLKPANPKLLNKSNSNA